MRKLKLRGVKQLAQGYLRRKVKRWSLNRGFPISKAYSVLLYRGVSANLLPLRTPNQTLLKSKQTERLNKQPSVSPPVVHFSIVGSILPRTPAMPPERGQRAHRAPQDRAGGRHFGDAVQLLFHLT